MFIDNTTKTIHFDSVAEMGRYARDNSCTYDSAGLSWYGGKYAAQSIDGCINGDDTQVDNAKRMMDQFTDAIELKVQTLVHDVAGAFPMIPAYLSGDPECFLTMDEVRSASAPLTILVDTTCSAAFGADDMKRRGTAILAVVMALAATRPVRLELLSVLDAGRDHRREGNNICFLRAAINSAPLDLSTAAFAMSDVSCARRVQYGIVRKVFDSPLQWAEIEGCNAQDPRNPKTMKRTLELAGITGEVLYIPAAHREDAAMQDPEQFVRDTFEQFRGDIAAAS